MKYLSSNLLFLEISIIILLLTSCRDKGIPVTIHAHFADGYTINEQEKALEIVTQRLKHLYQVQMQEPLKNGEFSMQVFSPDNKDLLTQLVTSKGEIFITETYTAEELFPYFIEMNTLIREDTSLLSLVLQDTSLLSMLHLPFKGWHLAERIRNQANSVNKEYFAKTNKFFTTGQFDNAYFVEYPSFILFSIDELVRENSWKPEITIIESTDTAIVNRFLNNERIKALFPQDVDFLWTRKPTIKSVEESFYTLIAIKRTTPIHINKVTAEDFSIKKSSYEDDIQIWFKFKNNNVDQWANMTGNNIGRTLAIISDNQVVIYPLVNSEITGGNMIITNDFSEDEAQIFLATFKGGTLDVEIRDLTIK